MFAGYRCPTAQPSRFQGSGSRGKANDPAQFPPLQQTVDIAAMKNIAATGRIDDVNSESRLMKHLPAPGHRPGSFAAASNRRGMTAKIKQRVKFPFDPGTRHKLFGVFLADDRMIDQTQQYQAPFAQGSAVEDRAHAMLPGHTRGNQGRFEIEPVQVQDPGMTKQKGIDVGAGQRRGGATMPENIPTSLLIDSDESDLAGPACIDFKPAAIDPFFRQPPPDLPAVFIISDTAAENDRHIQAGQRNKGGGYRPTALEFQFFQFRFPVRAREPGQPTEDIERALTEADNVETLPIRHQ